MQHLLDLIIPAAQAHEKWFVTEMTGAPLPPQFAPGSMPFNAAVLTVLVVCVIGFFADRAMERSALYARTEHALRPYRDIAPGILAVTTAVLLLWSAWHGVLLADNFPLPQTTLGTALRFAEYAVGALFLIGFDTAAAALGLGALYIAAAALFGAVEALDYLYFAGTAVFLYFFARGRYSLDWFYGKPVTSTPESRKHAYLIMRVLAGGGLIALALGKWMHPEMHLQLMDRYPDWNPYVIIRWIGFNLSRETYVLMLAVIESIVGVFVLGGYLTRFASVALMPVFMGSILFLGAGELVGHLPILGILVVLCIYGDTYHKAPPPLPEKNPSPAPAAKA